MLPKSAADLLKAEALRLGASRVGIARAGPTAHGDALARWLAAGHNGAMGWMARAPERRTDPTRVMPEARSSVVVAVDHPRPRDASIAGYAAGRDYHDVLGTILGRLADQGALQFGGLWRAWVDTGPILEREIAMAAGLGFIGKSTSLIHKRAGSYFLLGELLTDLELPADEPATPHCGTCTACLDLCPTQAFPAPYVLDSRRCISYLTIELKGAIPRALRPALGTHMFGCDVCQEVCPWNRKAGAARPHPELVGRAEADDPAAILRLDEEAFRARFRGTALARPRRRGMARNAAVVLGNMGRRSEVARALGDADPLVRRHAAWAMGRILRRGARDNRGPERSACAIASAPRWD